MSKRGASAVPRVVRSVGGRAGLARAGGQGVLGSAHISKRAQRGRVHWGNAHSRRAGLRVPPHRYVPGRRLRGHVEQQLLRGAVRHVEHLGQVCRAAVQAVARCAQAARQQLRLQRGRDLELLHGRLAVCVYVGEGHGGSQGCKEG